MDEGEKNSLGNDRHGIGPQVRREACGPLPQEWSQRVNPFCQYACWFYEKKNEYRYTSASHPVVSVEVLQEERCPVFHVSVGAQRRN